MSARPFVLLDRDGTLIIERHYLSDPADVALIPGAARGLRALADAGVGVVLVTNQSGVGRGYFTEATLAAIHERLTSLLEVENVSIQAIYYCPHAPSDQCDCRKPRTALAERAATEHAMDLTECFVIGDNTGDIALGRNIGATTFLVRTGHGWKVPQETVGLADYVVDDLENAARQIVQLVKARSSTD